MQNAHEIRQQLTGRLISALGSGKCPWRRPWRGSPNSGSPANAATGRTYRGINPLLLDHHASQYGFESRWWATFDQWKKLGGSVKPRPEGVDRGQWGATIILYRPVSRTIPVDDENCEERRFAVMRTWTVFNADQVDGVAVQDYRSNAAVKHRFAKFEDADDLIVATQAEIHFGGDKSYYARPVGDWPNHSSGDFIRLPHPSQFVSQASYYETAFHELAHWSEVRLAWDRANNGYPMGELIAEIASCYLANEIGIPQGDDLTNHGRYLASWLESMNQDHTYVFKAATQASKVTDFLMQFAPSNASHLV